MILVRLKELLDDRGMSQRELARRTGRHHDVISRFARQDTGAVSYDLLADICDVLNCEPGDLFALVPETEQIQLFQSPEEGPTLSPVIGPRSGRANAPPTSTQAAS